METALGYRVLMDKIAKGVKEVGDGVVDVAEEEMEEGEEAVRTISESKAYAPLRK